MEDKSCTLEGLQVGWYLLYKVDLQKYISGVLVFYGWDT
jgi:hypothetical protein